jgi:hypothetical protein
MNDTRSGMSNHVELSIRLFQIQLNWPTSVRRGASDFGDLELNPIRNIYPHAVLVTCRRTYNRAAGRLKHTGDRDSGHPVLDMRNRFEQ